MPSRPDPAIDERYSELAALLRESKPRPPEPLRLRVLELAADEAKPAPPPRRHLGWGPRLRVFVPVAAAAAIALVAVGVATRGSSPVGETSAAEPEAALGPATAAPSQDQSLGARSSAPLPPGTLPPATSRPQDYRVELRVRVRDLSAATARAMRTTRRFGGFVVSAHYDETAGADGDSLLVVRVPVGRVQDAIQAFSGLGTIVSQQIQVEDLQRTLDRQRRAIAAQLREIERLESELERTDLTGEQRAELRLRLNDARRALVARQRSREATQARAATARISVTMTTRDEASLVPPVVEPPGYFERTVRDAAEALGRVLTWTLAALIVASPAILLGILLVLLERRRRRAAEERLLARS
jgi:Domain of unknown function (DUF4349)